MTLLHLVGAFAPPETTFAYAEQGCSCPTCLRLNTRHPGEGYQLRLRVISSGGQPDAVPLPDPDAPATAIASVSEPSGRPVETSARGHQPEPAHV